MKFKNDNQKLQFMLGIFYNEHRKKSFIVKAVMMLALGNTVAGGTNTPAFKALLKLIISDGYIEEENGDYIITQKGIFFFDEGGYNPTLLQRIKKWIKKDENLKWIIGIIIAIVSFIAGRFSK